jgi:hypothetical protein
MSGQAQNSNGKGTSRSGGLTFDDIRELIIRELRAEALPNDEQDTLMQAVSEMLMERATLELMKSIPPEVLVEFAEDDKDLQDPANAGLFMERVATKVPNAHDIVVTAIKDGLKDYQGYLDKELARDTQ